MVNNRESEKFDKKLLRLPLKETGEEFLSLTSLSKKRKIQIIFTDKKTAFLRKSVAEALIQAAKYFNDRGFVLKVESVYRSLDEQREKFIARYKAMKKTFPKKSKGFLLKLANTYTAGIPILAAHTAGAAVDVTLLNAAGKSLDFGVPYPHGGIESTTNYPHLPKKVIGNRKLLKDGMEKYGLINYPFEYWHYSNGDVAAAFITGQNYAIYGPVNYNAKAKKIVIPKLKKSLRSLFKL